MTAIAPAPEVVDTTVPGAPAAPQVNLLPPEVHAGRQVSRIKSWALIAVLVALLVATLLYVWAAFSAKQAEAELALAQDESQALLAEQAQYAEVPQVLNQTQEIAEARELGMGAEVLWRPYLGAVAATAPAGVSIDTLSYSPSLPSELASSDPLLTEPTTGALSFEARSLTVPDTAGWMDALEAVTGVTNPWFSSVAITQDAESGATYYVVSGTVLLTTDALSGRFTTQEEAG
ncbi:MULTISPECIES: fimbrial assembly protein [unclassified Actinotalea]|uniref:fimbrial assembly protein n=1 Tax=unclassified Actinotalea TaxID=2638618 RepID=UPI0015F653BE|nr:MULTISPECIES: fimbrial assembly protein [unclassified Actinotalea]